MMSLGMLMGDEVAPRKKFIQTWAKNGKNLDVQDINLIGGAAPP